MKNIFSKLNCPLISIQTLMSRNIIVGYNETGWGVGTKPKPRLLTVSTNFHYLAALWLSQPEISKSKLTATCGNQAKSHIHMTTNLE